MADNYAAFRQAVLNSSNIQAPETVGGNDPLVQNLYKGAFQGILSKAGANAIGGQAAVDVTNQKAAAAQAQAAAKEKLKTLESYRNPSAWNLKQKEDGGFDVYDPEGNLRTVHEMATITGADPTDILANSQNPLDIQYIQDAKEVKGLLNAISSNDRQALDEIYKQVPEIRNMTPEDLLKRFRDAYPNVYRSRSNFNAGQVRKPYQNSLFGTGATSSGIGDQGSQYNYSADVTG